MEDTELLLEKMLKNYNPCTIFMRNNCDNYFEHRRKFVELFTEFVIRFGENVLCISFGKSKEFIEKFKKHFSTNRLEKKDAAYKCFAMESILKIDKKSNLTEEEIHKLIRNNMEKLLDDKNSLYFQIVDFVKKEYFGV